MLLSAGCILYSLLALCVAAFPQELQARDGCSATAVSPPPAKLHCGDKGRVERPSRGTTFQGSDPSACALVCLQTPGCVSFSFDSAQSLCKTANTAINQQSFVADPTATTSFSNKRCYTLTDCPVTTTSLQMPSVTPEPSSSTSPAPEPLPTRITWRPGQLNLLPGLIAKIQPSIELHYQPEDSNLVVYDTSNGGLRLLKSTGATSSTSCDAPNLCSIHFRSDGQFLYFYNGNSLYVSNTPGNHGVSLSLVSSDPYLFIQDITGELSWYIQQEDDY